MNPGIVAAGLSHSLLVSPDSNVYEFGELVLGISTTPKIISGLPPIFSAAAGRQFSLFVDHDGNAWGMGHSLYGQLGIFAQQCIEPHQIKFEEDVKIKMAAASRNYFSVFLDEDGSVWTCGSNTYGQLGLGHFNNNAEPTKIDHIHCIHMSKQCHLHLKILKSNCDWLLSF